METAINRALAEGQAVETNATAVYGVYTSGQYNRFYATESEAIAHCKNPENGAEFNGSWFQDRYKSFYPGSLFSIAGEEAVFLSADQSKYLDPVGGRWQMPNVQWVGKSAASPAVA